MTWNMTYARRWPSVLMGFVTAATLFGCVAESDDAESDEESARRRRNSPVAVGLWSPDHSPKDITDREKDFGGVNFDHVLLFMNIQDPKGAHFTIQPHLDARRDVVVNLEFWPPNGGTGANLKEILEGRYDDKIRDFVKELNQLERKGQQVWVRTLHEMNGKTYPWALNGKGHEENTIERYRKAYQHVAEMMHDKAKMQLNFMSRDDGIEKNQELDWGAIYPGDKHVDMIVFTAYNTYGLNGSRNWRDFFEIIDDPYKRAIAAKLGDKPFGISETSSMPDPNDVDRKKKWFVQMANDLVTRHPKIKQVSLFLENKGERCWDRAYPRGSEGCLGGDKRAAADKQGISAAIRTLRNGG
jgi:Glycosyl hydrolase family 26